VNAGVVRDTGPFWRALLVCPQCRAALLRHGTLAGCPACGARFGADGDTPDLRTGALARRYSLSFSEASWDEADHVLRRVARDPVGSHTPPNLPYHVDPAHAAVLAAQPAGRNVLEVGCGGGQCRAFFRAIGHRCVGIDISKSRVLPWLRAYGGPDLLCDTHFLPFRDACFDVVYCSAVFEHLACPPLAMAEMFRVLRPGGLFCGNASFLEPWHDSSFFHLSPLGAVQLLLQAGFEPMNVWPGRAYSGFDAISAMAFARPLRPAAGLLGRLSRVLYKAQLAAGRCRRRLLRTPQKDAVLQAFVVAGATDWIARRPALGPAA
jgi:SAM-dependent methyltransferase